MYTEKVLEDGTPIRIIVSHPTYMRLKGTCFRAKRLSLAGNFFRWDSPMEVINDRDVLPALMNDINKQWKMRDFNTVSISIMLTSPAGWESTAPRENYQKEDLEEFKPNKKSKALRIKKNRKNLLAPKTSKVTVIYQLTLQDDNTPVVMVHSMYPGTDVGELTGNITEREGLIFFDWNHPGVR
jgi:hypothetical protein